jgi:hypothetical protein
MSVWTLLWVAWGLAFAVIEGLALFNSRAGDTLSEHAWAWLGIKRRALWRRKPGSKATRVRPTWTLTALRVLFGLAMLWLGLHLTTGWV